MIVFIHEWKQLLPVTFIVLKPHWIHDLTKSFYSGKKYAVARCGGDKEITYNHKSGAYHLSRNPFSLM